jgi:hypothetical protein
MEGPLGFGRNESAEMTLVTVIFRDGSRRELEVTVEEAGKLRDLGTIPSERSDLSGAKIGENEKDSVVIAFTNGTQRRLVMKAEEAEELKDRGRAIPGKLSGITSSYYRVPKSLRLAIATVFLGALLTPAISRQFTDRQQESELKSRVSGQIHVSSIRAMQSLYTREFRLMPEFRAEDEYCELYKTDKTVENKKQCESAVNKAKQAALKKLIDTQVRWDVDYRVTWNELRVFRDSKLRQDWREYFGIVYRFSKIGVSSCGPGRDERIKSIHAYLSRISPGQYDQVIKDMGGDTKPCAKRQQLRYYPKGDSTFLTAYDSVHDRLISRSAEIALAVERGRTTRYSVGFWDFLDDLVTPFGSD